MRLFEDNRLAWAKLLEGGTARPIELPREITTELRANPEIRLDGGSMRLHLIEVTPDWSQVLAMDQDWWCGDWPPGVQPHPRYLEWRLRHCEFLRDLDRFEAVGGKDAERLAKLHGLNLERDCALTHGCDALVTPGPHRAVTDAGHAFVERWGSQLGLL